MRPVGMDFVAGIYPLLHDETCFFVAVDFDGVNWRSDARAYVETCAEKGYKAPSRAHVLATELMHASSSNAVQARPDIWRSLPVIERSIRARVESFETPAG
jgi:hypothetical protein